MADTKRIKQSIYFWIFRAMSMMVVFILVAILYFIVSRGIGVINWDFLTKSPEEGMVKGGIFPAIVGTLVLIAGSLIFAFPVGVFSAIYLNEYMKKGKVKSFLQLMTNNLAGVPSVVFGLFGMALFVNKLKFGDSIIAGSLTLGLLVLPVIIRTTEEALKAVDDNYRLASYAMGASKLYTIKKVILPIALPDIITGLILSIGRVSGETAPILFTVAAYFLPKLPHSIFDQVMALPYHLYVLATSGTNIEKARPVAFGTALVLVMIVLFTNIIANVVRAYYNKKYKK
ncbi:MAG: phosphate ABC transporter permease PstA [Chitinophagaceae bacterium]|nr:phosphate ABC transporter permease PstA [Chitinophagaceae bacterium]